MTEPRMITAPVRPARSGEDALTRAAFERHPFGLLVTRASGTVVVANGEAARVLGREDLEGRACCALLGCGTPGTSLADACLTEQVLAAGRPLPEVRVDIPGGESPGAVWVTASPLTAREALLHLRPGRPGDRRRRSDSAWTAGPEIAIQVLGRTRVHGPGGPLDGPWLRQRPGLLLKLLVANRRRLTHSEQLAHAFWPTADRRALQNVRYCVHDLRGKLEPARAPRQPSSFVTAHDGGYGLDLDRVRVATARAGNVVGGGDWAADRLVPDAVRAWRAGRPLVVRAPDAVRPWQHVLEPVSGYLLLAERLLEDAAYATAWNFGPDAGDTWPVRRVVETLRDGFDGLEVAWGADAAHEAPALRLDATRARERLGWRLRWDLASGLAATVWWYGAHRRAADARKLTYEQIEEHARA